MNKEQNAKKSNLCSTMRNKILRFLNLIFLLSSIPLSISLSQLHLGDSLSVTSNFITSPDNSFTCGFHSLGTNAYWFSIWFTNKKDQTVVWMANRNKPVNGRGSKVTVTRNGAMVLTDVDGTVVWQTNTAGSPVSVAELLNSGNLVLRNHRGEIVWQSFDSPTDTLLPSQIFTKYSRLISSIRKGSYESGYYNMYYGTQNVLRMVTDGIDTSIYYWPNPVLGGVFRYPRTYYNGSRLAVLDDMGRFMSSDSWQLNASDMGYGIRRRLVLDYDGNLRIYSLNNSTGLWDVTCQAISQPCLVKGVCGRNALCVYAPEPKCTCPPGFVANNTNNWNYGCVPIFDPALLMSREVKFLEIPHAGYFGNDLSATIMLTWESCRDSCIDNFLCLAFGYSVGDGTCYLKSALLNGDATPDDSGTLYLRVPNNLHEERPNIYHDTSRICASGVQDIYMGSSSMYSLNYNKIRWGYVFSFAGVIGGIELVFVLLGWWFLFRKHGVPSSVEAGYKMISGQFRQYGYSELKKATKNFKEELGRGGSGAVYKGVLADHRVVAVKRLGGDFYHAEDEYSAEISTIGKINHMNLVRMWGFCSGKRHRILVYEYVENLSLDRHIFGEKLLSWEQRYTIAIGTAKGLAYLHHECLEWVIHCDVKPENILLDSAFQPKIADFGLAKLSVREGTGSEFTRVRGTKGYMAPEWALNHPITAKVDVFGFGVVILEMVRGIRVCNWTVEDEKEAPLTKFTRSTKVKLESGNFEWVESVVDSRLKGKFSKNKALTLIKLGVCCVEEDRNKRPTMASVVQTLLECENDDEC